MAEEEKKLNIPNLQILGQDDSPLFQGAGSDAKSVTYPKKFANHPGFKQVFQPGKLTFGLMAPFKGYPDSQIPDVSDLFDCAKAAEAAGFDALWIRDVPFYDPYFGDVGQGLDPIATLGALAMTTDKIVLGSAGFILPERNPIHVAQAAVSIDRLSNHRFLLGLVSGDRKNEFKAFGRDWNERSEIFREGWDLTKKSLTHPNRLHFSGNYYSKLTGSLSVVPQLEEDYSMPLVAIGRCRQELSWLANEPDAWIWHGIGEDETAPAVKKLNDLNEDGNWHPFGYQNFVELLDDPDAPCELFNKIYLRGGAKSMAQFWRKQRKEGLNHVIINFKPTKRPIADCLADMEKYVFPEVNKG